MSISSIGAYESRQGRPERQIVNTVAEWKADLAIICSRAQYGDKPRIGPKSLGHVARFVLDNVPCPVLVRPRARGPISVER
ncbi:MAG: universal stress protein [Verrucomicrobia bacterium]|nr:universal stress protein [Verrucomicrobiota bacterium]